MDYKEKYESLLRDIDIAIAGQKEGEIKTVLQNLKERHTESDDERIRKSLLSHFSRYQEDEIFLNDITMGQIVAWLEKQGEHKLADKIEQKFKVGDVMRTPQEAADSFTDGMPVVVYIDDEYYHCTNALIAIKNQDDYEYPPMNRRQKTAWSEDDNELIDSVIELIDSGALDRSEKDYFIENLKSLKDRYTWKPSDEQNSMSMLVNLGYPISTNGEIPTYEDTFNDCKNSILHCLQEKVDRVIINKRISLGSGGINTETLLEETYMQAYREGVDDIIKKLKEICI